MKTLINDTELSIIMTGFEEHTHDEYLIHGPKPFRFAYITLTTEYPETMEEPAQLLIDHIECFVNVNMIDGIIPELEFQMVNVALNDYESSHSVAFMEEILQDLTQAIKYNEI